MKRNSNLKTSEVLNNQDSTEINIINQRVMSRSDLVSSKVEMKEQTFFTIFTPIYNRKHTIHRVWDSLINQTNKNFEWLIIDNGSEDNILPLLEEYKSKADFTVKIYTQVNLGKYKAFNRVLGLAEGELLFPADSDDTFEPNLIERMGEIWAKYKGDDISGITMLCKDEEGKIIGKKFPIDESISTYKDIHFKHKVWGEKWGCIRVDILKKYPFPTNHNVKYFPDGYVWDQIGFNYKTVFINEPLRTYFQDAGNQIMKEKNVSEDFMKMKNFYTLWKINYVFPKVSEYLSYREYYEMYVFLWLSALKGKVPILQVFNKLEKSKSKIIAFLLLIPSYFINLFNLKLNFLRKKKY